MEKPRLGETEVWRNRGLKKRRARAAVTQGDAERLGEAGVWSVHDSGKGRRPEKP